MKKNNCFILFLVLVAAFSTAQDKQTLTVLDFQTNNVAESDMKSIISFLSASLFETDRFRVIDTTQRETILKELEFSASGCTDEECQLEIGRLLSAEIIVVGDIAKVGNRFVFTARMIATETSETSSTAKAVYQSLDDLIDGMTVFAAELAGIAEAAVMEEPQEPADEPDLPVEKVPEAEPETAPKEKAPLSLSRIAAWSTLGIGVAVAGTGGYLIYDALAFKGSDVDPALAAYNDTTVTDFGTQTPEEYYADLWAAYLSVFDVFKGKAFTALIVTGAGVVSMGASAALFLIPGKKDADVSFLLLPLPEACSFRCRIRL